MQNISRKRIEKILEMENIHLIIKRDDKRYIKRLSHYELRYSNALYKLLYDEDSLKGTCFNEIKNFEEEYEKIYSTRIYYDKKFDIETILEQLPITVQDSIYAIEIVTESPFLMESLDGRFENVDIYQKLIKSSEIYDNGLSSAELYSIAKNIDFYYILNDLDIYKLEIKDCLLECLSKNSIDELFVKYGKKSDYAAYIPAEHDALLEDFVENETDISKGMKLIDFLKQAIKDKNNYSKEIFIKSPFRYLDLNMHKHIEEAQAGYLVYEYFYAI